MRRRQFCVVVVREVGVYIQESTATGLVQPGALQGRAGKQPGDSGQLGKAQAVTSVNSDRQ